MFLLLATLALAAPADTPFTVTGSLGASAGPPSLGGFGALHVAAHFGAFGVELIGTEGLMTADARHVGGVHVGGRWRPSPITYLRAGFIHHHETPFEVLRARPLGTLIGSADGIGHRSGAEVGFGVDLPVPERLLDDRLGFVLDLSMAVFPDDNGPHVYVLLEQGWSIDIGRRRAAPVQ